MRIMLLTAMILVVSGCAGTSAAKRNDAVTASGDIPVLQKRPSLIERQRVSQQKQAEMESVALTDVKGNVTR